MITEDCKIEKAKWYANHVREVAQRAETCRYRLADCEAKLGIPGIDAHERVTTSPQGDAIPEGIIKLHEMMNRYDAMLVEYTDEIDGFNRRIDLLPAIQSDILYKHYIGLLSWNYVSKLLGYSRQRVSQLRRSALAALYDVMPEDWRSRVIPDAEPKD